MEAPYSARATAQANPIPEDAPTISARLFFKENDGVVGKFISSFHPLLRYQETLIYLIPEVCGKHLFQLVYTYQEDQLIFLPLYLISNVCSLYLEPLHTSHLTYTSARKCISTFIMPSPWQASHLPPFTLKLNLPGL